MKNKVLYILALVLSALYIQAQTERINFTAPKVYPEGVAFDEKTNTFYVSSVKTGTIGAVEANGTYKEFYKDASLKSSFGMKVDAKKNRLWVCISDPNYSEYSDSSTFKKMARVIVLDLSTGKKVEDINLSALKPGKHFANDIVLDDNGNAYVTDSFSPLIYKIDEKGRASIFANSPLFGSIDVGLNGLVYHPEGYLLVAHNTNGSVLKVPLKTSDQVSKVKIENFFPGADGMLIDNHNNLILIVNKGIDKVYQLTSNNNWRSAEVTAVTDAEDRFQNPTTATVQRGKIFVLNSKMNELSDSTKTPSKEYSLQALVLKPIN